MSSAVFAGCLTEKDAMGACCFGRRKVKNASQMDRRYLLVDLAVRRCVGMQPAGRLPKEASVDRVGKSAAIWADSSLSLLVG